MKLEPRNLSIVIPRERVPAMIKWQTEIKNRWRWHMFLFTGLFPAFLETLYTTQQTTHQDIPQHPDAVTQPGTFQIVGTIKQGLRGGIHHGCILIRRARYYNESQAGYPGHSFFGRFFRPIRQSNAERDFNRAPTHQNSPQITLYRIFFRKSGIGEAIRDQRSLGNPVHLCNWLNPSLLITESIV